MHVDTRNIPQLQSRRALSHRLRAPRADEREAEAQTTRSKAELFSAITCQRVAPASTRASEPCTAATALATPQTSGPRLAVDWHRHVLFQQTAESLKAVHEIGACALRTEHTPTHDESTHAYLCGQPRRRNAGQVAKPGPLPPLLLSLLVTPPTLSCDSCQRGQKPKGGRVPSQENAAALGRGSGRETRGTLSHAACRWRAFLFIGRKDVGRRR